MLTDFDFWRISLNRIYAHNIDPSVVAVCVHDLGRHNAGIHLDRIYKYYSVYSGAGNKFRLETVGLVINIVLKCKSDNGICNESVKIENI